MKRTDRRKLTIRLSPEDRAAAERIRTAAGLATEARAIRYALRIVREQIDRPGLVRLTLAELVDHVARLQMLSPAEERASAELLARARHVLAAAAPIVREETPPAAEAPGKPNPITEEDECW